MSKNSFLRGAMVLTMAGIVVKILGGLNRILLSRLLGGEGIGLYQMAYPAYDFYDTLCVSRRKMPGLANHQLHTVAAACGYKMENHHHALADAEACAWIAREIL